MITVTDKLNKFEDWFRDTYTLEDRSTNPSLKADTYAIWSVAFDIGYDIGIGKGFDAGQNCHWYNP